MKIGVHILLDTVTSLHQQILPPVIFPVNSQQTYNTVRNGLTKTGFNDAKGSRSLN